MAIKSGQEIAEKHARRLKASTQDIISGVQAVTENPMKKAAANLEKAKMRYVEAIDSGKTARALNSVSTEEWKDKMINKGVSRISAGVDAAIPKTAQFFDKLMPHVASLQNKVKNMPNLTLEDSANRMVTFMRGMADFKK